MASLIFDFDGTIADSLPLVLDIFYKASNRPPFSKQEVQTLREMHVKGVLDRIGIPLWKAPNLLVKYRSDFGKRLSEVKIFEGVGKTLKSLHQKRHKIYLMSTNSTQNITKFLTTNNVVDLFDSIDGNIGIFGKAAALKSVIKKHSLSPENCYYIGDETRDIEAATKAGIKSIAVTWGYNGPKILKAAKPDWIVNQPSAIAELIQ